jgi:phosphoribosylformylglycinamidine cyclo-ligase
MVVDDLVACGAEPLFLQDYVACGRVVPERIAAIVTGIAEGCTRSGAALVGGETAEHGDLMAPDDYDLAATAVGVVEADAVLGPERVRPGDVVVAMASSGFHSNGYSLVRRVVSAAGLDLTGTPAGLDRPLGDVLLEPTRIYALDCLALVEELGVDGVHAFAHITGGGLAGNTVRVVPDGAEAVLDRGTWALPAAVHLLEQHGVPREESERAFNCGVGMVAVVAAEAADRAVSLLTARGVPAWVAGTVHESAGRPAAARLEGDYQ